MNEDGPTSLGSFTNQGNRGTGSVATVAAKSRVQTTRAPRLPAGLYWMQRIPNNCQ